MPGLPKALQAFYTWWHEKDTVNSISAPYIRDARAAFQAGWDAAERNSLPNAMMHDYPWVISALPEVYDAGYYSRRSQAPVTLAQVRSEVEGAIRGHEAQSKHKR